MNATGRTALCLSIRKLPLLLHLDLKLAKQESIFVVSALFDCKYTPHMFDWFVWEPRTSRWIRSSSWSIFRCTISCTPPLESGLVDYAKQW